MNSISICAVFDIGKTNKKLLAFNTHYEKVYEVQVSFEEITDDDGIKGDDLESLSKWIKDEFTKLRNHPEFEIKAVNISAYGASLVHLDIHEKPATPFYNYLKTFSTKLRKSFEKDYNQEGDFFVKTASPDLGMLNSGLQLYWLKYEKPALFEKVKYTFHLPQYCNFLLTGEKYAEKTSIGCHTAIWDFTKKQYHEWLEKENISSIQLPIIDTFHTTLDKTGSFYHGVGIHDSSAALVPYLIAEKDPFILLSTGTWCVTMNPFNDTVLTKKELQNDCLNFISYKGDIVRASRLFSGNEHNRQSKHLADYFHKSEDYYKTVSYDPNLVMRLRQKHKQVMPQDTAVGELIDCPFVERNLNLFQTYEEAYHQFIIDLVAQQMASMRLTYGNKAPSKIYVDGGFAKNKIFMNLLSIACFDKQVYASDLAQASSLGAALVIADKWTQTKFTSEHLPLIAY